MPFESESFQHQVAIVSLHGNCDWVY